MKPLQRFLNKHDVTVTSREKKIVALPPPSESSSTGAVKKTKILMKPSPPPSAPPTPKLVAEYNPYMQEEEGEINAQKFFNKFVPNIKV